MRNSKRNAVPDRIIQRYAARADTQSIRKLDPPAARFFSDPVWLCEVKRLQLHRVPAEAGQFLTAPSRRADTERLKTSVIT
jgi:hypothetical protein